MMERVLLLNLFEMGLIVGKLKAEYFGYKYKYTKWDRFFGWVKLFVIIVGGLFIIWLVIMIVISKLN